MKIALPILPKDDVNLKKRLFIDKYMPELTGMTASEWNEWKQHNPRVASVIEQRLYDRDYADIAVEYMTDVLIEFTTRLSTYPYNTDSKKPKKILESIDGVTFYQAHEKEFYLAFCYSVLSGISRNKAKELYFCLDSEEPNAVSVYRDKQYNQLQVKFLLEYNAWDCYHLIKFDPNQVEARPDTLLAYNHADMEKLSDDASTAREPNTAQDPQHHTSPENSTNK